MGDFYVSDTDLKVAYHEAENILLVDRWDIKEKKKDGWNTSLILEHKQCWVDEEDVEKRCSQPHETNTVELCRNEYSDYNYYAVCRNIFLPKLRNSPNSCVGLLHDTPTSIDSLHHISQLVEQCAKPLEESRSFIVTKLIEILAEIVNDLNLKQDL